MFQRHFYISLRFTLWQLLTMNMKQTTLHRRSINILQFLRLSNPPRYKINTPLLLGFFFYFFAAYHVSEAFARRYSVKNVFLKISQNSPENTCARVSFLINLQSSPPVAASDTSPISRSISACIYWTTDNAEQVSSSTRDE